MKNFIFKSDNKSDLHKILFNKLDMLLAEQRHQRSDLSTIMRLLNSMNNEIHLQKQVDDFYATSPQTDSEEHFKSEPGDIRVD